MSHKPDIDHVTGVETTGHEWDGIKELDTPMPRWWLWIFYATIIFVLRAAWTLVAQRAARRREAT